MGGSENLGIVVRGVLGTPPAVNVAVVDDGQRAAVCMATGASPTVRGSVAGRWATSFPARPVTGERCGQVSTAAVCCEGWGDVLCVGCWAEGDGLLCLVCWHRRRPVFEDVVITNGVL